MSFRAVTFYTNAHYEAWARNLKRSTDRLHVHLEVTEAKDAGTWQANTLMKASTVQRAMDAFPKEDILWLDADNTLHQYPQLFDSLDGYDMATYLEGHAPNGSVTFIKNNEVGREVVRRWIDWNIKRPNFADDQNFYAAAQTMECPRIMALPPAYSWSEPLMRRRFPRAEPVIEIHLTHQLARIG